MFYQAHLIILGYAKRGFRAEHGNIQAFPPFPCCSCKFPWEINSDKRWQTSIWPPKDFMLRKFCTRQFTTCFTLPEKGEATGRRQQWFSLLYWKYQLGHQFRDLSAQKLANLSVNPDSKCAFNWVSTCVWIMHMHIWQTIQKLWKIISWVTQCRSVNLLHYNRYCILKLIHSWNFKWGLLNYSQVYSKFCFHHFSSLFTVMESQFLDKRQIKSFSLRKKKETFHYGVNFIKNMPQMFL